VKIFFKGGVGMSQEKYRDIIMSLEGLKRKQWENIKEHIDKQFDSLFLQATKEQALVVDKDLLKNAMPWFL